MDVCREFCLTFKNILVEFFLSIFKFFIPPERKSVLGGIVLITGSGSGIGRSLSKEFAKLGATVVLCDINSQDNLETERQIKDFGGKCFPYTCDVSKRHEVYKMGESIVNNVGHVTMLINNAGIVTTGKSLLECPDDMIEKIFQVNLLAQFWTVKCFLPDMLKKNHGHIINMASSTGLIGLKNLADYSSSKFGVVGFTEVLNYELAFSGYDGIHTTLLCPSFTETGLFEGCKMRFPWVIPPLTTQEVTEMIVKGILTNQNEVYIPRLIYTFSFIKSFMPVKCMLHILKFFGADTFMDNFVGRKESKMEANGSCSGK